MITNATASDITAPLHVYDPGFAHELIVQKVTVQANQSLWLPVNIPLSSGGLWGRLLGFCAGRSDCLCDRGAAIGGI